MNQWSPIHNGTLKWENKDDLIYLSRAVPAYFPAFVTTPIAFTAIIHFVGDIVNALSHASFLNPSNSTGLKSGLCRLSHNPKNSIVNAN